EGVEGGGGGGRGGGLDLNRARHEAGMARDGEANHGVAVERRNEADRWFVRRRARRHEQDAVELEALAEGFREDEVPQMDRVERAAQDAEPPLRHRRRRKDRRPPRLPRRLPRRPPPRMARAELLDPHSP